MQKRRFIPLLLPDRGRIASVCLVALFAVIFSATASAQTDGNGLPDKSEYNKDVRTGTWSIYAQGGLSWATDVWYENVNAKKSYGMAPAVGGGVDYTIRPWVRVGAEYLWSRYRREQRLSSLDAAQMPVKAYGNYLMNYHNAKLGVGFNFMEFWPRRQAQWLNIWVGTGAGYMMAKGNEYGIYFNTTITENGTSKPATGDINIDNNSSVSIQGNVRTTNEHSSFNKLYIPLSLHMEFDVTRRLTIGVKGEMDFVMKREDIAPKNLLFGMATVRYNIVPSRAQKMQACYDASIDDLNYRVNELQKQADAAHARAEKAETDLQRLAQENAGLQRQLRDCEQSKVVVEKPTYTVQFDHNSSYFNKEQGEALKAFARQLQGKKLSLLAESSSPGSEEYNQALSERRLMRVIQALQAEGFTAEQLKPCVAIGAQRGIDSAEARRVTITVE
ncbi:MAG: OmpA family protein [Bacteroidaceae bacterium]|nr:OmpA family protein [Bacteroidaceae bacterium]